MAPSALLTILCVTVTTSPGSSPPMVAAMASPIMAGRSVARDDLGKAVHREDWIVSFGKSRTGPVVRSCISRMATGSVAR